MYIYMWLVSRVVFHLARRDKRRQVGDLIGANGARKVSTTTTTVDRIYVCVYVYNIVMLHHVFVSVIVRKE